jgi:hypothetical protein
MDRREFLAKAGLVATWAAITVKISGCGDDEENPVNPGNGDVPGDVSNSAGHTHSVTITEAQIDAGVGVTLTLQNGGTGHTHTVSLTTEEVMAVGAGDPVTKVSTSDSGHTHVVTFN